MTVHAYSPENSAGDSPRAAVTNNIEPPLRREDAVFEKLPDAARMLKNANRRLEVIAGWIEKPADASGPPKDYDISSFDLVDLANFVEEQAYELEKTMNRIEEALGH